MGACVGAGIDVGPDLQLCVGTGVAVAYVTVAYNYFLSCLSYLTSDDAAGATVYRKDVEWKVLQRVVRLKPLCPLY